MDFYGLRALSVLMDENQDELMALIGSRIATRMEDVIDLALTLGAAVPERRDEQVAVIVSAVSKVAKLASALEAVRK